MARNEAGALIGTISPQPSPDGARVLLITLCTVKPRTRKGAPARVKPAPIPARVKPAPIPPPPTVEVGETVKPRVGASLARVCTDGKPARYVTGRSAEIASMHDGYSVACYEIGDIILRDAARNAEAKARGLDARGFVPSWDAPRSSEASENPPKISFATAENTAKMDAHNARVQPIVDRISAHNALVEVKYGAGIAHPCHNNARKVRRKCRTYGASAARRPLHHVCQMGCVNVDAPTGTVGAVWRNRPVGRYTPVDGPSRNDGPCCRRVRQHCALGQIAPLWRLTGDACGNVARKARAKFQKVTARNFRGK